MTTLYIPPGFAWVGASLLSLAGILQWQTMLVGGARKKAGIAYPRAYAEKAEQEASKEALVFNCAQRAHQNTLENGPVIVITTLIGGLRYPILAAAVCALWSLTRVVYTVRYSSGEPRKVLFLRILPCN
ncbi:hypothetical protein F5148DRAFT_746532 [Russula earlei]|uniref:Uncharacterized protein n=1 Tax=Russula earlei TaxID=71964 RepID=A0ACC0UEK4_9AGAM|nr:hypothetical protein F5148DRAFT_746532 [Russula earlei]